jgi:hypothetical protein
MQTKQYTVILLLALCLSAFSSKAILPGDFGKSRPTDSIMNLRYNAPSYPSTLKALAKMDKAMAAKLDSAITYLKSLPAAWPMTKVYQNRMPYLRYRQFNGYTLMVEQEYMLYTKIDDEYPEKLIKTTKPDEPIKYDMVFKPVIYLYPDKEQKIDVNLGFDGTDLYTWPQIDSKQNWNVTAQPDGMLKDATGEEYPYLFWEGVLNNYTWIDKTEGFIVPAGETETFLRDKLKILGLNSREYTDFITFWGPRLRKNKYNLIRFETAAYDKALPLTISPAPESSQRIMMVYKPLNESIDIKPQTLKPFTRKGYTVIEWGGMQMPEIVN